MTDPRLDEYWSIDAARLHLLEQKKLDEQGVEFLAKCVRGLSPFQSAPKEWWQSMADELHGICDFHWMLGAGAQRYDS